LYRPKARHLNGFFAASTADTGSGSDL